MDMPEAFPEAPYGVSAFRVSHIHAEDEPDYPGTLVLELAGQLRDTEAQVSIPFEMTPETVLGLVDELIHQYRCLVQGLPEDYEAEDG